MAKSTSSIMIFRTITPNSGGFPFPTLAGARCFPPRAPRARKLVMPPAAVCLVAAALLLPLLSSAQEAPPNGPAQFFVKAVTQLVAIFEAPTNQSPRTFTTTVKVIKAEGLPKEIEGHELELAVQAPEHIRLAAKWDRQSYSACRDGQEVWIYAPGKQFGLLGSPDKALYATAPTVKDTKPMGALKLPFASEQLAVLPFVCDLKALPDETIAATQCRVLKVDRKS